MEKHYLEMWVTGIESSPTLLEQGNVQHIRVTIFIELWPITNDKLSRMKGGVVNKWLSVISEQINSSAAESIRLDAGTSKYSLIWN